RAGPVLSVGRTQVPPEPQSWFLRQPRNWLLEHLPAICAAPKTVTQTARSASPSWLRSMRAQASPVLLPVQFTSSNCHRRESVVAEEEHAGPGSHSPLKSFWPGWSSGPCPSLMQTARTGAAARRPHTSVTADSRHTLTTFRGAAVAAPQESHPRADFVVLLAIVIFCLLRSDRAVLPQTLLRGLPERALLSVEKAVRSGPAAPATRSRLNCVPR